MALIDAIGVLNDLAVGRTPDRLQLIAGAPAIDTHPAEQASAFQRLPTD